MALRLPPLATLRSFEAAARLNSFKLAASELGLTPSAVSHGIDTLEKWLEARLFERGTRKVTLTPVGRQFLPYVSEGLSMIAVGTQRVTAGPDSRRVRVSVAPTFASQWLLPRLSRFARRHPKVTVMIDTSHRQALFPLDGVDLAIRMGKGAWPGTTSHLLLRETLLPVGAPDYIKGLKAGRGLDWSKATLLHVDGIEHDWESWFAAAGIRSPQPAAHIHFDTVHMALDAAARGLGLAMGREPLVAAYLADGRLTKTVARQVPIETGYWLTSPAGKETRRDVEAFRRWLLAEARGETSA